MTIIYITQNNTKRYGVTFQNNGCVKVQKFEDISNDENTIYSVKPMRIFLGKSQVCDMTMFSGAFDKKMCDGNTILHKISEENEKHKYVYIGGDMVCSFMTSDNIYEYIPKLGIKFCPYSVATVKKITFCWLRILNLLKRIRLIIILYCIQYTFQIQI